MSAGYRPQRTSGTTVETIGVGSDRYLDHLYRIEVFFFRLLELRNLAVPSLLSFESTHSQITILFSNADIWLLAERIPTARNKAAPCPLRFAEWLRRAVAQRIAAEAEQKDGQRAEAGNSFKKLQQGKFCEYEHVVIVSSTTAMGSS